MFNPTAQIINPCDSVFTVKYSIKLVEEAFDKMLNHSHEIGVSQLRTKSDVSVWLYSYIYSYTCMALHSMY